ncbi:MAG: type 4a pilus biogenesis protein PilO [Bryobacteraceae bacterium]|jgi:type IV pilus assembly protein PilO
MPLKLPRKVSLPTPASLTDPKFLVRSALGLLLAANLVAAAMAYHIFDASPEALNRQLSTAIAERQALQAQLTRTRTLNHSVDRGKQEGDKFLSTYMTSRRHTYSTIIGELTQTAQSAGMKAGATISLEPIQGSDDLDMMTVTLTLEGNYAQLMKFVNLLDRSPRFLIIETLTVTPRAKSDILSVGVKLDTFVKDDTDGIS